MYKALLPSNSQTLEKLDGFIAEKNITIDGQQALSFEWKYWLKLEIPANAAGPSGAPPLEIGMVVLVSGPFEFPPDTELVSAVFGISISRKPCQPVLLLTIHYVDLENSQEEDLEISEEVKQMHFVRANYSQPALSYQFEYTDKGKFSINSEYGSIQLEHSSLFSIAYKTSRD